MLLIALNNRNSHDHWVKEIILKNVEPFWFSVCNSGSFVIISNYICCDPKLSGYTWLLWMMKSFVQCFLGELFGHTLLYQFHFSNLSSQKLDIGRGVISTNEIEIDVLSPFTNKMRINNKEFKWKFSSLMHHLYGWK